MKKCCQRQNVKEKTQTNLCNGGLVRLCYQCELFNLKDKNLVIKASNTTYDSLDYNVYFNKNYRISKPKKITYLPNAKVELIYDSIL